MKVSPPLLSPILRSDVQGLMLAELYLKPEARRTVTELADTVGVSVPSASREMSRLVTAHFALSSTSGRNRYLWVNRDHPTYQPMYELLMYAYGPRTVLSELFQNLRGIHAAHIYGSWAARLAGEPGPDPQDIDVIIIADSIERSEVIRVSEFASKKLGREVNTRIVSPEAWENDADLFLRHLRKRPLVSLLRG